MKQIVVAAFIITIISASVRGQVPYVWSGTSPILPVELSNPDISTRLTTLGVRKIGVKVNDLKFDTESSYSYMINSDGLCYNYTADWFEQSKGPYTSRQEFQADSLLPSYFMGNGCLYLYDHESKNIEVEHNGLVTRLSIEHHRINGVEKVSRQVNTIAGEVLLKEKTITSEKYGTLTSEMSNLRAGYFYHQSFVFDANSVIRRITVERHSPDATGENAVVNNRDDWQDYYESVSGPKYFYGMYGEQAPENELSDKVYQFKIDPDNFRHGMLYLPTSILHRFCKLESGFKTESRFNQQGDQYLFLVMNERNDTLEHILLDSVYLYPLHHRILLNGEMLELVENSKLGSNGVPIEIQSLFPDGKVYQTTYVNESMGVIEQVRLSTNSRVLDLNYNVKNGNFRKEVLVSGDGILKVSKPGKKSLSNLWEPESATFRVFESNLLKPGAYTAYWDYNKGEGATISSNSNTDSDGFLHRKFQYHNEQWMPIFEERFGPHGLEHSFRINEEVKLSMEMGEDIAVSSGYWDTITLCFYNTDGQLIRRSSRQTSSSSLLQIYEYNEAIELLREEWFRVQPDKKENLKEIVYEYTSDDGGRRVVKTETEFSSGHVFRLYKDTIEYDDDNRLKCLVKYKATFGRDTLESREGSYVEYSRQTVGKMLRHMTIYKAYSTFPPDPQKLKLTTHRFLQNTYSKDGQLLEAAKGYVNDGGEVFETNKMVYQYDSESKLLTTVSIYEDSELQQSIVISYE